MTDDEKKVVKLLFERFKGLYYKQKVLSDMLEEIIPTLQENPLPPEKIARIEDADWKITEVELEEIENLLKKL
ncbi:hypothetical protein [Rufibacter sp. XAAS-G3-1]|uniref:hypothetical protein n=1 Tax=Rufibacter sp. XAAS-G3-1 TaxID=2729134 RepID=UPI0015E6D659|nr:hypothetical protein [Rufibacter sp. XAAS-G3-1]